MDKEYRKNKADSLKEELAECMENIQDEFSVERIDEICAELSKLEENDSRFDINKSKDEFFRDYLPLVQDNKETKSGSTGTKNIRFSRRLKRVVVLAAVIIGLFGVTSVASGKNYIEAILNWSNEGFHISAQREYDLEVGLEDEYIPWSDLEDQFKYNVPNIGYFSEKMYVTDYFNLTEDDTDIVLTNGENDYIYSIHSLDKGSPKVVIEKTEKSPYEYVVDNVTYYFVYNKNWINITWQHYNDLHIITGVLNDAEAIAIVDSISYK